MNWIWAIIVGIVLGFLAKLLLPGKQDIPWWLTIICGILGAILGNAVAGWIGVRHTSGVDWIRHVLQILGAVLVVAVITPLWASIRGRRRRTAT
ncbi:GlsB/YeaQ/YmgE family stress response membrane protein [Streptomyces sp. ME01-24h]|nr:GlsB/YeaQ/YmgE family stress response membrane protein [Streptomyces sp. ME19-03-3]MDX3238118.1 GlsB/YeaQ/YmgE family stress response membrane protein [Streptomyces sp. ME03-5709C]MDX3353533.1 GlsB/YeaQ/YmgE family stress response membrane protein [Streptomyces sp. ME01-24h]